MKHSALLFLTTAVLMAVSPLTAASPVVISHFAEAKKSTVSVRITEEVKLVLPPSEKGGKGFEWQIISHDPRVIRLVSSPRIHATSETVGTNADEKPVVAPPGSWSTTFLGLRPGRSIVRFVYFNPDAGKEVTPVDTREIIVTVYQ